MFSLRHKKKKRTIESKVAKKTKKLFDLTLEVVSDEIAMRLSRKVDGDGLRALHFIEEEFASGEVDRAEDLRSEMKDLDPDQFVNFGECMEAECVASSDKVGGDRQAGGGVNGACVCA